MKNKMCDAPQKTFKVVRISPAMDKRYEIVGDYFMGYYTFRNVPRIRIKCPVCGRKLLSSVKIDHDGYDIYHVLPPHKIKGWWKKKNK